MLTNCMNLRIYSIRFYLLILVINVVLIPVATCLFAQNSSQYVTTLDSVPDRITLDANWKYKKGDNEEWAGLDYDDYLWDTLSTRLNLREIDEGKFEGKGWFRLHLKVDSSLFNKTYALLMNQSGTSEIFLNGKKIETLGIFENDTTKEERYNPRLLPIIIQFNDHSDQVLAIRYSHSKATRYSKRYYNHQAGFTVSLYDHKLAITQVKYYIISNYFFLGLIMIFGILGFIHFLFFLFYRKKISNLYYSIFLLICSLLIYVARLQNEVSLNPDIQTKLGFFVSLIMPFFFVSLLGFIYSIFYHKMPVLFRIGLAIGLVISIMYFLAKLVNKIGHHGNWDQTHQS